ncbi:hypothetical protein G6F68_009848 [Rhizopus microsporus]|nr:hypothetical protein G6F68_009848 [Rhizopus microsporus]
MRTRALRVDDHVVVEADAILAGAAVPVIELEVRLPAVVGQLVIASQAQADAAGPGVVVVEAHARYRIATVIQRGALPDHLYLRLQPPGRLAELQQRLAGLHRILLEVRVREQDAFHRTHGVGFRHSDGNVLRAAAHQAAYGCAVAARDHDFPSRVATALATDMHGDAAAVGTEDADAGAIAGGQGSSNGAGRRCGAHRGRKRFWQTRDESRHALLGQRVGHAPHFGISTVMADAPEAGSTSIVVRCLSS